ncbi:DUF3109 family protein [uncultured Draconibacterium sp.]|uniref:DUF3109 family protein n=1 Tax=uncultured Draconibacterium sp. TaxID=1573823 RepID=UPI0029C992B5|nr:DUF3109 family protein [uncultured Draconibacterium sp.]
MCHRKAHFDGKIRFPKPLSCYLFLIRITEYKRFDVVNCQELDICKPGRRCGASEKLPLYKFLKESLTAKYGVEWYGELEIAADYILSGK